MQPTIMMAMTSTIMRPLNEHGTYQSDWDTNTRLMCIVTECHGCESLAIPSMFFSWLIKLWRWLHALLHHVQPHGPMMDNCLATPAMQ